MVGNGYIIFEERGGTVWEATFSLMRQHVIGPVTVPCYIVDEVRTRQPKGHIGPWFTLPNQLTLPDPCQRVNPDIHLRGRLVLVLRARPRAPTRVQRIQPKLIRLDRIKPLVGSKKVGVSAYRGRAGGRARARPGAGAGGITRFGRIPSYAHRPATV